MKIRISYDPADKTERTAANLIATDSKKILKILGVSARVKETGNHPPRRCVYISTKAPNQDEE